MAKCHERLVHSLLSADLQHVERELPRSDSKFDDVERLVRIELHGARCRAVPKEALENLLAGDDFFHLGRNLRIARPRLDDHLGPTFEIWP